MFNEMFNLDIRHYCGTLLHPKYRSLKGCSEHDRSQCYKYIREQLNFIRSLTTHATQEAASPEHKKFKQNQDLFSRFEDDYPMNTSIINHHESGDDSNEYEFDIKKSDELDRYLVMEINKPSLSNDPLEFWKAQSENMPFLSRYAKQIHSISATAASVERQFSAAGLVFNDRRTNLNPNHLDNILLIRSLNRMKWHVPRPVVHSIWIYLFSMIVRKHF